MFLNHRDYSNPLFLIKEIIKITNLKKIYIADIDAIRKTGDNNILIDKQSASLLKGSEIDYVDELIGESFKINNPQTKSSCGCGVSFSL